MNDDEIRDTLEGLARRGGLTRLLLLLGFTAAPRGRTPARTLRTPLRTLSTTARETLRAHVVTLRGAVTVVALRELVTHARAEDPLSHHLLVVTEPKRRRVIIACDALREGIRHIVLEPSAVRSSDLDVLRELAAVPDESGTAAALRIYRALDRRRLTSRFFRDIRSIRDAVARRWTGLPDSASADRDALALLLISRLLFLYFLQRRGLLNGDPHFLPRLFALWRRGRTAGGTFYRLVLRTLFFGVLNRRPERRTPRARSLGALPYLNGGLFEKHRLELCRPALDLPDDITAVLFDSLLEKYRFTSGDPAGADGIGSGIDPEMLGRIFEGLMPGERRSRTGTFYTPAAAVDTLVVDALATHLSAAAGVAAETVRGLLVAESPNASDRDIAAVASACAHLRVLDPACGSGAFLLGALAHIASLRTHARAVSVEDRAQLRREIVAGSLHGVDLLEDAALICSLRLWLALIPHCDPIADVPPLPNLDRRIRQGDALVDPLDLGAAYPAGTAAPEGLRPLVAQLAPAARAYLSSEPDARPALRRALASLESRLARTWMTSLEAGLDYTLRDLHARAGDMDLFGAPTAAAEAARARLPAAMARRAEIAAVRQDLRGSRALPFFSFRVHFAEVQGFDIVLSNPPWVRARNWPPTLRRLLRERFRVCSDAGWPYAAASASGTHGAGAQVDLAFLFLERALHLLREGGTLAMMLPAKLIRSLAPGGARALLLTDTRIASLEDHSLDQSAVFEADAFTAVLVARRRDTAEPAAEPVNPPVRVRMTRGTGRELRFEVGVAELPLRLGDARSPWLLAPPDCAAAFRFMQRAGGSLGDLGLSVRRGAMTGANDVMVVQDLEPKLGDIARIRTEGWYARSQQADRRAFAGHVEASVVRPILRGCDVHPWRARGERHLLYTPLNDTHHAAPPPRLAKYLHRHRDRLAQPVHRLGLLQRLSAGMFGSKVVWSDLAADLRAAAVPPSTRTITGLDMPIVPLNTVYFIATADDRAALLLAAYLNSLPLRTFARAIAERAKDAHFRFFAWTIAALPLPRGWSDGPQVERLAAISRDAHDAGCIAPRRQAELDAIVARAFGLDADQMQSIAAFDAWLAGRTDDA